MARTRNTNQNERRTDARGDRFLSRKRRVTLGAVLALAVSTPLAATALATAPASESPSRPPSQPSPQKSDPAGTSLAIPKLSGPYAVGRETRHLVDRTRRDPWVPAAGARELMVSMYYPARARTGSAPAPYMTRTEAELLLKGIKRDGDFPADLLASTRTHARTDAAPAGGKHPLVVLSPGFSLSRSTLTFLAEDLASRGYVVAQVDHAHEAFGTSFPGGRTLTCEACDEQMDAPTEEASKKVMQKVVRGRAADLSYVLDTLGTSGGTVRWKAADAVDRRRIGVAGHSIGGNTAAQVMERDTRVRAGVNLDGTFFAPVPEKGLGKRPFLMLGTKNTHSPGSEDASWPRDWARLDGWKRWLTVADSGHFTFNDLPVLAGQLGVTDPEVPLSGTRSGEITTRYVAAFFDRHLRHRAAPLLDGPTKDNPEVEFQNP